MSHHLLLRAKDILVQIELIIALIIIVILVMCAVLFLTVW